MKKENFIQLIIKLEKIPMVKENIKLILQQDEKILEFLSTLNVFTIEYIIEIIQIYANTDYDMYEVITTVCKSNDFDHMFKLFTNDAARKAKIVLEGAKIMNKTQKPFQKDYAFRILTNKNILEAGKALEYAELFLRAKEKFHAEYVFKTLIEFQATHRLYIFQDDMITEEQALEFTELFLKAKKLFHAIYIHSLFMESNKMNIEISLKGAQRILKTYTLKKTMTIYDMIKEEIQKMEKTIAFQNSYYGQIAKEVEDEHTHDIPVAAFVKKIK